MLKLNRTQIHEVAQKAQIQLKEGTTPEIVKENIKTEVENLLHQENIQVTSIKTVTTTDIQADTKPKISSSYLGPDVTTSTETTTLTEASQIKTQANMVIDVVNSHIDNPGKRLLHLYSVLEDEYNFLDLEFLLNPFYELPFNLCGLVLVFLTILKLYRNYFIIPMYLIGNRIKRFLKS